MKPVVTEVSIVRVADSVDEKGRRFAGELANRQPIRGQIKPRASIASATWVKPAMFAPIT